MTHEDARKLVGRRVLVVAPGHYNVRHGIEERRVLEVSPSGEWTKMMNDLGREFWILTAEFSVVEVLQTPEGDLPEQWRAR